MEKNDLYKIYNNFISDAKNFNSAAKVLSSSQISSVENQMFLSQIIFLKRHSCELLLKGTILKLLNTNTLLKIDINKIPLFDKKNNRLKKTLFESHSILELFDCLASLSKFNLLLNEVNFKKYRLSAIEINKIDDDSTYFRYPCDKDGNLNSRTYFINADDPNIYPDFNDYKFEDIYLDEINGNIKFINIVPEAYKLVVTLSLFYDFLFNTQVKF